MSHERPRINRWEPMETFSKHLRWIITCLVFYALPLLMICYGLGTRFDRIEATAFEQAYAYLDRVLVFFRKNEKTEMHLSNHLNHLLAAASNPNRKPDQVFRSGVAHLKKWFPGMLRIYVVDHSGKVIPEFSERNPPKIILKQLFEAAMAGVWKNNRGPLDSGWSRFGAFIGPDCNPEKFLSSHQQLVEVNSTSEKRWFYFGVNSACGLFVHADHPDDWDTLGIRDKIRRFHLLKKFADTSIGYKPFSAPFPGNEMSRILAGFMRTNQSNHISRGTLIRVSALESAGHIWAGIAADSIANTRNARLAVGALATMIFAGLCWLTFSVMTGRRTFFFSIRWRLVVLFFFGSSLPLMVIFLAGWDYLGQKYETDVRHHYDQLEQILRTIDARFPQIRVTLEQRMNDTLRNARSSTPKELESLKTLLKKISTNLRLDDLVLYNRNGESCFEFQSGVVNPFTTEKSSRGRKIMGEFVANLTAQLNHEPTSTKSSFASGVLESFGGLKNPVMIFGRSLGRVTELSLGENQGWTYMRPIRSSESEVSHMVVAHWRKLALEEAHLTHAVKTAGKLHPGVHVYAAAVRQNWWAPEKFFLARQVKPLLVNLDMKQGTINTRIFFGRKPLLATGIKPKEVSNNYLVAMMSEAPIHRNLFLLECRLGFFALATGLISIFLGINLSQRFLTPIEDLNRGIDSIRKREFENRLPVRGNDELGEISGLMNHVMEGMGDLQVARVVQESLFPQKPLDIGTYRIYGKSRAMTDIGGDYFDYFLTSEKKLIGLVGDVSGHGVSAALIMGMAKCAVNLDAGPNRTLLDILNAFNLFLLKTIQRKKMMTMFLFQLDPETHLFSYTNAGHNYPFIWKAGEEAMYELDLESLPLGMRNKPNTKMKSVTLEPGDCLLFYTDGLVEAPFPGRLQLGYLDSKRWFYQEIGKDPVDVVDGLFARFDAATAGFEVADDVSMICLKRIS